MSRSISCNTSTCICVYLPLLAGYLSCPIVRGYWYSAVQHTKCTLDFTGTNVLSKSHMLIDGYW